MSLSDENIKHATVPNFRQRTRRIFLSFIILYNKIIEIKSSVLTY